MQEEESCAGAAGANLPKKALLPTERKHEAPDGADEITAA